MTRKLRPTSGCRPAVTVTVTVTAVDICGESPFLVELRSKKCYHVDTDRPGHLAVVDGKPGSSAADEARRNSATRSPVRLLLRFSSSARRKHFPQRRPLLATCVVLAHKYRLLRLPIPIKPTFLYVCLTEIIT